MRALVLFLAIACAGTSDALADDAKADQKAFQGTWSVTAMENEGKQAPMDSIKSMKLTFEGNKYSLTGGEEDYEGTFKIDSSKSPKQIDTTVEGEGDDVHKGIYELNGETLKICWSESGSERPAEFRTKPNSGQRMVVVKRMKSDKSLSGQ